MKTTVPDGAPASLLERGVEHYYRSFCTSRAAQAYLARRGLTNPDLLKAFRIGYADGSLLKRIPRTGEVRDQLRALGVITATGRELLGGCIVVPIPDPRTGTWTTLYGRGVRMARHCYLPGPLRGVWNFQAARSSDTVILTESVLDALSFHQAGIATAMPIYGTQGCTADHLDLLTREQVRTVILALDGDDAGRMAAAALKERLTAAGLTVRVVAYPARVKDANELLVSANGNAPAIFREIVDKAEPMSAAMAVPTSLFLSRDGGRVGAAGLRARIQYHGRRIGVRLTPHGLRHACATHLLRGGADLRHVQALLGHRRLTTTALYTRVAISDLRAVLARCHPRMHRRRPRPRR